MSNYWCNLRLWCFHLQVENGRWLPRLSFNDAHWPRPRGSFFEVYEWRP